MLPRVRFERPPVMEVVCGVQFHPLAWKTVHYGLLWQTIRGQFPTVQDMAPLHSVFEQEGRTEQRVDIPLSDVPPLPRSWFLSADARSLIQVQSNRFLFNWKREAEGSATYLGFDEIRAEFELRYEAFEAFCADHELGTPSTTQFELTYVNHIGNQNGLDIGLGQVLRDHMVDRTGRFLPEPEGFRWITSYPLRDGAGRLHVTAQTALKPDSRERLLRLDLLARGTLGDGSRGQLREWFTIANEAITNGFVDLTNPVLHGPKYWRRTA